MNERYRYGYGDEPGERDSRFSRQGSMTDPRAGVDQGGRSDEEEEEDEERRADRIRQADSETQAAANQPAAGEEPAAAERVAATSSSSVFDVEEEATGPQPIPPGDSPRPDIEARREAAGGVGPVGNGTERPPIALGPPSRTTDQAPASAPAEELDRRPEEAPAPAEPTSVFETAGAAEPEAATAPAGPPAGSPAAVPTGVGGRESDREVQRTPATETEMLVPGSGPAPVAAPDERTALLGSMDAGAIRARFLDIQAGFVDEPRQAVQEAERFVDELVQGLVRALENERAKLKATIDQGSTEDLRLAVRGYRAFVERLLNLTM